jgi:DNA/RNA-binding domain of Phe-tRNA-synthetase-like protein
VSRFELNVDPRIWEQHPGYSVLLIYAEGIQNGPSDDASVAELRAAEETARATFAGDKASTHPHVSAWREAFARFGAKPSKFPCSVEALLSRVLKGQELPAINRVVDLYNAVSIRHVLPVGGEDWDRLTSDAWLRPARGDEPFVAISGGEEEVTYPEPGEVIWADDAGVTCRRWNWRQCHRTRLMEQTRNAYFVLDSLAPYSTDALQAAGEDLVRLVKAASPDCTFQQRIVNATTP